MRTSNFEQILNLMKFSGGYYLLCSSSKLLRIDFLALFWALILDINASIYSILNLNMHIHMSGSNLGSIISHYIYGCMIFQVMLISILFQLRSKNVRLCLMKQENIDMEREVNLGTRFKILFINKIMVNNF